MADETIDQAERRVEKITMSTSVASIASSSSSVVTSSSSSSPLSMLIDSHSIDRWMETKPNTTTTRPSATPHGQSRPSNTIILTTPFDDDEDEDGDVFPKVVPVSVGEVDEEADEDAVSDVTTNSSVSTPDTTINRSEEYDDESPSPSILQQRQKRVLFDSPIARVHKVETFTPSAFRITPNTSPNKYDDDEDEEDGDDDDDDEDKVNNNNDSNFSHAELVHQRNAPLPPPAWMRQDYRPLLPLDTVTASFSSVAATVPFATSYVGRIDYPTHYLPHSDSHRREPPRRIEPTPHTQPTFDWSSTHIQASPPPASTPSSHSSRVTPSIVSTPSTPFVQLPQHFPPVPPSNYPAYTPIRMRAWESYNLPSDGTDAATPADTSTAAPVSSSTVGGSYPFTPDSVSQRSSTMPPMQSSPSTIHTPLTTSSSATPVPPSSSTTHTAPSSSHSFNYPTRDSFKLEEAELDAQIAAAQLSLLDADELLVRHVQSHPDCDRPTSAQVATSSSSSSAWSSSNRSMMAPVRATHRTMARGGATATPIHGTSINTPRTASSAAAAPSQLASRASRGVSLMPRQRTGNLTPRTHTRNTSASSLTSFDLPMGGVASDVPFTPNQSHRPPSSTLLAPTASFLSKSRTPARVNPYTATPSSAPSSSSRARPRTAPSPVSLTPRGFGSSLHTGRDRRQREEDRTTIPASAASASIQHQHGRSSSNTRATSRDRHFERPSSGTSPTLTNAVLPSSSTNSLTPLPPSMTTTPTPPYSFQSNHHPNVPRKESTKPSPKKRQRLSYELSAEDIDALPMPDTTAAATPIVSERVFVRPTRRPHNTPYSSTTISASVSPSPSFTSSSSLFEPASSSASSSSSRPMVPQIAATIFGNIPLPISHPIAILAPSPATAFTSVRRKAVSGVERKNDNVRTMIVNDDNTATAPVTLHKDADIIQPTKLASPVKVDAIRTTPSTAQPTPSLDSNRPPSISPSSVMATPPYDGLTSSSNTSPTRLYSDRPSPVVSGRVSQRSSMDDLLRTELRNLTLQGGVLINQHQSSRQVATEYIPPTVSSSASIPYARRRMTESPRTIGVVQPSSSTVIRPISTNGATHAGVASKSNGGVSAAHGSKAAAERLARDAIQRVVEKKRQAAAQQHQQQTHAYAERIQDSYRTDPTATFDSDSNTNLVYTHEEKYEDDDLPTSIAHTTNTNNTNLDEDSMPILPPPSSSSSSTHVIHHSASMPVSPVRHETNTTPTSSNDIKDRHTFVHEHDDRRSKDFESTEEKQRDSSDEKIHPHPSSRTPLLPVVSTTPNVNDTILPSNSLLKVPSSTSSSRHPSRPSSSPPSRPSSTTPREPFLGTPNDMLTNVFRFYAHPMTPDADMNDLRQLQLSRTDLCQFLIECDLLETLVTLARAWRREHERQRRRRRQKAIRVERDEKEDDGEDEDDEDEPLFQHVWSAYCVSAALVPPTPVPSSSGSSTPVTVTGSSMFSFESFSDLCGHLALVRSHPRLIGMAADDDDDDDDGGSSMFPSLSSDESTMILIDLFEHAILPNSSLYRPRSLLEPRIARFRTTPLMALWILFKLEDLLQISQTFLKSSQAYVREVDHHRCSSKEYQTALRLQWQGFIQFDTNSRRQRRKIGMEPGPRLFQTIDEDEPTNPSNAPSSSPATLTFDDFTRIIGYKSRYDSDVNTLRRSCVVTLSVWLEVCLAACEKRSEALSRPGDTLKHRTQMSVQTMRDTNEAIIQMMENQTETHENITQQA